MITIELLLDLAEKICVILVIAYLITRTKIFHEVLDRKFTIKNMVFIILVFGALSIFGTYSGITINGAMGNVRDLGPMIAGLVGGPVAGLGAGLIGGLYRYFFLGGITTFPCSLSTVLAGLFAGIIYILNKRKFIGIMGAVLFAASMEAFHMILVFLLAKPYPEAFVIAQELSIPMIVSNAMGMLIFAYFITNLTRERKTTKERDEYFDELQRKKYELEIAHEIQESFLPQEMPNLDGYDIFALNLPAKEVGGDFYDFIPISKDKIGVTIADVSGKSVPAALFMAVSRTILRAKAMGNSNAAEVIEDANKLIAEDSDTGMFVTLFYAILDLKNKTMEYVNAGHNNPVLFIRKTGTMECLNAKGIALGAIDTIELEEKQIDLESGDLIVFYTDGVTEAINDKEEFFGKKRLYKLIKSHSDLNAEGIVNKIKEEVISFSQSQSQFDDITLMVIKVN
ncbi:MULTISPECIES: SpoIIE family protein phosphatase [Methanobacterium]|uniref:Stage II sporulation protein E n=1 Tax=Methanobacterium bryantii TaxID=2161 RepID=A0A2A2H321_METBR|nr:MULTISPECIES: SpoIIE family protein phosphatase [Methanobacterium]OEC87679.1 stage II sporulation protein E [Methanobacterium sp. A39]PAV03683.1 stage II sporulation protein E [Methanobacterium bryantii]